MAQLLVRNVPDYIVALLKQRAHDNGRSVEAEHRALLDTIAKPATTPTVDPWAEIKAFQAEMKQQYGVLPDSTPIIRHFRDTNNEG